MRRAASPPRGEARPQKRRGLSFVVEGVTASRPSRHPNSSMSSFARHSASSIAFHSRMGAVYRGYRFGFSAQFGPATHFSLGEISRPLLQWRDPAFLQSGVRMGAIHRRHMITSSKADRRAGNGQESSFPGT